MLSPGGPNASLRRISDWARRTFAEASHHLSVSLQGASLAHVSVGGQRAGYKSLIF